jgi:hypothetical protein
MDSAAAMAIRIARHVISLRDYIGIFSMMHNVASILMFDGCWGTSMKKIFVAMALAFALTTGMAVATVMTQVDQAVVSCGTGGC